MVIGQKTRDEHIADIRREIEQSRFTLERNVILNLNHYLSVRRREKESKLPVPIDSFSAAVPANYFETSFSALFKKAGQPEYQRLEELANSNYLNGPELEGDLAIGTFAVGDNELFTTYSELIAKIQKNYDLARTRWKGGQRANPQEDSKMVKYSDPIAQLNYTLEKMGIENKLRPDYERDFFEQYDETETSIRPMINQRLDVLAKQGDKKALANAVASLYIASRMIANIYDSQMV